MKSSDKRQSSGAAEALGRYAYVEVNQALLQVALQELAQTNPNTFVIGNAVKALIKLATPQDVSLLKQIKSKIEQLLATETANRAFPHINGEVDQAIQAASQRRDALASLLMLSTGNAILRIPAHHGSWLLLVSPAQAADPQDEGLVDINGSPVDESTIQRLIADLYSDNARASSAAAKELGKYRYVEVQDALVTMLRKIFTNHGMHRGYSYTVNEGLASLEKISTFQDRTEIQKLRADYNANRNNPVYAQSVSYIDPVFDKLEASLQTRTAVLPRMQKSAKDEEATLEQLIRKLKGDIRAEVQSDLLPGVEEVLYDKSVNGKKAGTLTRYYGRTDELEKVAQAILRGEKGHVILSGKAGVGKTTILRMLSDGWVTGKISHPGEKPPILLELSITDVTNATDPSAIKKRIAAAQALARGLDRHVVLFVDEAHISTEMTRNAMKSFLSKELGRGTDNRLHFVWATTSQESRSFISDSAFSRRWVDVSVPEFSVQEAIESVKAAYLPRWKTKHTRGNVAFSGISEDAYAYAAKNAKFEQPHAGNPTGIKELLEGAIVYRMRELEKKSDAGQTLSDTERNFTLETQDIRNYLTFQKGFKLVPGDPRFDEKFEKIWSQIEADYEGNEGLKHAQKSRLRAFFSTMDPRQLDATLLMGPPGGGKSYWPEVVAKHFFGNKPLEINLAEYREGGLSLNKLIGSPTGTVGSEEQRSVLTKYIRDNPKGGVFVFEEADFGHKDIFNWLVNTITSKKFTDGLGQEYDLSRFMIVLNTNMGQNLMIADEGRSAAISWEDIEMRRRAITHEVVVDGRTIREVRPDVTKKVFEEFITRVSAHSEPNADTSVAEQDGKKLLRRITPMYVLPPTEADLRAATHKQVAKWVEAAKLEHGVTFQISNADIDKILDLKGFRFEEGYGYIGSQLDKRLFTHLTGYLGERGKTVVISVGAEAVQVGKRTLNGHNLQIAANGRTATYSLGLSIPPISNPWFSSEEMVTRIRQFPQAMAARIKGQDEEIMKTHAALRQKAQQWSNRIVVTKLGTSGNGKTEFFYSMAETLFGGRNAAFKISGIQNWGDLNNYFRSDTGFVGSKEVTEFEKWFMSRKTTGGGVIILDELLSFSGLSQGEIAAKVTAINKLYDMLDEGVIRFGNRTEDARGFVIGVTGNAMQELFDGIDDSPEAEKLVKRIEGRITQDDVIKYFSRLGIDAPKVARFGVISVRGPLDRATTQAVGQKDLAKSMNEVTREISQLYDVNVKIDPAIVDELMRRVTTVRLGMRNVNKALRTLVIEPVSGIFFDQSGTTDVEAKLVNGQIVWTADGIEVVQERVSVGGASQQMWVPKAQLSAGARDTTPQLKDITEEPKIKLSPVEAHLVALHEIYGHWMTGYLLTGKNSSETISLIPGDGYLGYVRQKENLDAYEGSSLVSWLKEAVILESGARAVFISGFYSGGGGTDGQRQSGAAPTDDLGRVNQVLDAMLSNQIFTGFTEFSNPAKKELFKEFMRDVSKGVADRIIRYGMGTKTFKSIFDVTLKERYISAEKIEENLSKVDFSKISSPDQLLIWSLANSVIATVERAQKKNPRDLPRLEKMASFAVELVSKTATEVQSRRGIEGKGQDPYLNNTRSRVVAKLAQLVPSARIKSVIQPPDARVRSVRANEATRDTRAATCRGIFGG